MADQEASKEHPDEPAPAKPAGMDPSRRRLYIAAAIVVVLLVIAGGVVWWLIERNYESTDDAYIDAHVVLLSPQVAGRVLRVDVNDNARVEAGQLLVEIDPADTTTRLSQSHGQVAQGEAQIAQARVQIRVAEETYQQDLAAVAAASATATKAASDLKRYRGLAETMPAAVAPQQIDQALATAASFAAQRDQAARQAKAALAQVDAAKAQLAGMQAELDSTKAQFEQAHLDLGYTRIVAPVAGTIAQRSVAAGNYVQPGEQLLAIVPLDIWITAKFKETQLTYMRPGQKVDIVVDAYPGIAFYGHVDSIERGAGDAFALLPPENATGNYVKVVQRVPVKIIIDGPPDAGVLLGPGMSVDPTVHVR